MSSLNRRTAIVTGVACGLGAAATEGLAPERVCVALVSRTQSDVDRIAHEIPTRGRETVAFPTDVGDSSEVERLAHTSRRPWGDVDILVNNAAVIDPVDPVAESAPDDWQRTLRAPEGSILLNLSRGAVPGEDALLDALGEGRPSYAGLDVLDEEPRPDKHPFQEHPRTTVTPHVARYSPGAIRELRRRSATRLVDSIRRS